MSTNRLIPSAAWPTRPRQQTSAWLGRRIVLVLACCASVTFLLAGRSLADGPGEATAASEQAAAPKTVRLLTIGNSFSRNATRFLDGLVEAAGHELIHQPLVIGGASLELHANKGRDWQRDPEHENGKYSNGKSLQQILQEEPWDVVTIQQASIRSHNLDTFEPHAQWLADTIAQLAPTARLHIHQTWAYRVDDPRFQRPPARSADPATQQAMYQGLAHAYQTTADRLGAELIPVGTAFFRFDTDPDWGFRPDLTFDFENATPPNLPNQDNSLHVGWRWQTRNGQRQLAMDGHHANLAGEYLGACVWFEKLYGESVLDHPFVPEGLAAELAARLRQVAHETVESAAGELVEAGR